MKQTIKVYKISDIQRVEDYGTGCVFLRTENQYGGYGMSSLLEREIPSLIERIEPEFVDIDVPTCAEVLRQCYNERRGHGEGYYRSMGINPTILSHTMDELYWTYGWHRNSVQYKRIQAVAERYGKFVHYCKEIAPQWENVGLPTYWADNSITQEQRNKYGDTRTRYIDAPHGDACY